MARNKSVKRTVKRTRKAKVQKNTVKKRNTTATGSTLVSVQKMEKVLMQTPSKLAAQLSKEISTCKKLEAKLKASAAKSKNQVKTTETRIASILNAKSSTANKKKLNKAKKTLTQTSKTHTDLGKQLEATTKTLTTLLTQQSKLTALGKYLRQFETEWVKSTKSTNTKTSAKKSKVKKSRSSTTGTDQPSVKTTETTVDDVRLDEITELMS